MEERNKTLNRRRDLAALDAQRAKILAEEAMEDSGPATGPAATTMAPLMVPVKIPSATAPPPLVAAP